MSLIDGKYSLRMTTLHEAILDWKAGIREQGGENKGPEIAAYLKAAGIGIPAPWCMAFINAMAERAAKKLGTTSPLEEVSQQAYVEAYYQHGKKKGWLIPAEEVLPGDLILLYYPTLKRHGHVGIVLEVWRDQGYVVTIEGNTSSTGSREGDGVYKKKRAINDKTKFLRWSD